MVAKTLPPRERVRVRVADDEHVERYGVTARRLVARTNGFGTLAPSQLERWLLDSGFARQTESGRLVPTPLGSWVGGAINFLGE